MKNALVRKTTLIISICFFLSCFLIGQDKELALPHETCQLTDNWCWAACMEMVIKYHDPMSTITQCSLAINYKKLSAGLPSAERTLVDNKTYCCPTCVSDVLTNCPSAIGHGLSIEYFAGSGRPAKPHYIDLLFASTGFNSSEERNGEYHTLGTIEGKQYEYKMPWLAVKQEIDSTGPFIIVMATPEEVSSLTKVDAPNNNHLVVVKGYATRSTDPGDYDKILIHDPWLPACEGHQVFIPYNVFQASAEDYSEDLPFGVSYTFNEVLAIIHSIKRKMNVITPAIPSSFDSIPKPTNPENSFLSLFRENQDRIIGARKETYDDKNIADKLAEQEGGAYYKTDIKFISFYNITRSRLRLDSVTVPHQIIEVVSVGVEPDFVTTFEKIKGLWTVKKIATFSYVKPIIDIDIKGEKLILSNLHKNVNTKPTLPYSLVKFPPFLYEFYSFNYQGKNYMSPAVNYPELKMHAGVAYDEKYVLRCLCIKSKKYIKFNKLFDKQILKQLKDNINY